MNQSTDKTGLPARQQWVQLSRAVIMIHWTAWFKEGHCLAWGKLIKLPSEGVFLPLRSQNQPVVSLMMLKVPLSGITFKWLRGAMRFLFIQEPGADNRAINDWKLITSHFCRAQQDVSQFNQEQKVNGCRFSFVYALISSLLFVIGLFGTIPLMVFLFQFCMDAKKKNSPKHFNLIKYWIMKLCHHWLLKDIIHKNSELLCGIKENNQLNGCVHHQRSEFDRLIICVYLPKTARTFFHTLAIQASRQRHAEGVFSFTSALRNTITRQWRPPQRNTAAAKLPF